MGIRLSGQDSESEYSKIDSDPTHDAVFAIAPSLHHWTTNKGKK